MSALEFVGQLRGLGVDLRREGDDLVLDAPAGVITSSIRERINRDKAAILEVLGPANHELSLSPRAEGQNRFPQSSAQQRLWYLDQLDHHQSTYNIWMAFEIRGSLDFNALERSVQEVVRRHDALRTTFALDNEDPVQIITPSIEMVIPTRSVSSDCTLPDPEEWLSQTLENTAGKAFDLGQGPLVRTLVVRMSDDRHVFVFASHHIVIDGWSLSIIRFELMTLYDDFANNRVASLPAQRLQYPEFAIWHRQWLQGADTTQQLAYWLNQLGGRLPLLDLPTDHPRPHQRTEQGSQVSFRLEQELVAALNGIGRECSATLYMVLLTAFQVLLARYTGQDDIVVGSPIANRTLPETESIVGLFANTLVMRSSIDWDSSFEETLAQVRETCLGAYSNQDVPFDRLVEKLNPQRTLNRTPVFQALLAFEDHGEGASRAGGLEWVPTRIRNRVARTDVTLLLEVNAGTVDATFEYSTDLFDAATVERMAEHLRRLLEGVVANPKQQIGALPLLGDDERKQLLITWNAESSASSGRCLHEEFQAQVERSPDDIALIVGSERFSYRELDARANEIADLLGSLGVTREASVGICLDRTADLVAAILGTLKAGGAYLPLDPGYPVERLAFMVGDSETRIVLTDSSKLELFSDTEAQLMVLDGLDRLHTVQGTSSDRPASDPNALAYVIYTSGSTGVPKGVAIEHRSAIALLDWARDEFSPEIFSGTLLSTSICFDLSIFELFVPLSCGGTVVLAEDAMALATLPARNEVTLINTVPSAMRALLQSGGVPDSVTTVNLAGEPLPTSLVDDIYAQTKVQQVFDLYGPTEDTTYSTWTLRRPKQKPTIGRPITNTTAYVLDRNKELVPVGVPGELYLGGAGLARGYLNRPELTAERFVPHPFSDTPGARLYRTGDLVRYSADGNLEFLGRTDHLVKVRGYRIELGEIEAALLAQDPITEAVATVHGSDGVDPRLVAYVVFSDGDYLTSSEIRQALRLRLPAYMVPGIIVELDALPMTLNGKIDRKRLPDPFLASDMTLQAADPPDTTEERLIAEVWCEHLGLDRVNRQDNFFELGGHSLMSLRVVAALEERTGKRLDPRLFFFQSLQQLGTAFGAEADSPA